MTVNPLESIQSAAARAILEANRCGGRVGFTFNTIRIVVWPQATVDGLVSRYRERVIALRPKWAAEWRASNV